MKKLSLVLFLVSALIIPLFATASFSAGTNFPYREFQTGGLVGYCARLDLEEAYGEDRIAAWSRMESAPVERAIRSASSEIDGFLISGGYAVPFPGPPENLKKYCVDLAAANLLLSAGVLDDDPGGKAIIDEAKNARHFLAKVAEGRYRIPGYVDRNEDISRPPGGVKVSAPPRMDLRGY